MRRIVITGANGVGKSRFAKQLAEALPQVPVVGLDALKLKRGWQRRDRDEIEARLRVAVAAQTWIIEGGPSLLEIALPRADALVWLDPPTALRAWRLARRPWTSLGQTRAELPTGNPDRLSQQYAFALRSLAQTRRFRREIAARVAPAGPVRDLPSDLPRVFHCRTGSDTRAAFTQLVAEMAG